jgi:hypothetical protein
MGKDSFTLFPQLIFDNSTRILALCNINNSGDHSLPPFMSHSLIPSFPPLISENCYTARSIANYSFKCDMKVDKIKGALI